ncbi:hypothetical protein WJX84_001339 [Apatococcus fuscideae]|uniref:Uncharacterized protein n=1 Tax=Apatococcus fuscideae TaxID=2026836 RepID=A0AAW1SXL7_9CHLO
MCSQGEHLFIPMAPGSWADSDMNAKEDCVMQGHVEKGTSSDSSGASAEWRQLLDVSGQCLVKQVKLCTAPT